MRTERPEPGPFRTWVLLGPTSAQAFRLGLHVQADDCLCWWKLLQVLDEDEIRPAASLGSKCKETVKRRALCPRGSGRLVAYQNQHLQHTGSVLGCGICLDPSTHPM